MPVRFDCQACGEPWWAPPANGCPRCGYDARAIPDPIIWTCGQVAGTRIWITGQMRTPPRFDGFVSAASTPSSTSPATPTTSGARTSAAVEAVGVRYVRIPVEDTNVDLPDEAFEAVRGALDSAEGDTVLFCAAGLKRAPHLLYGVLRRRGAPRTRRGAGPCGSPDDRPIPAVHRRRRALGRLLGVVDLVLDSACAGWPSSVRKDVTLFEPSSVSTASARARNRGRALRSSFSPSGESRTRYERRSSGFGIRSAWPRSSSRRSRNSTVESGICVRVGERRSASRALPRRRGRTSGSPPAAARSPRATGR